MDFKSLPSQYDHAAAQSKWYSFWEDRGYFHASADSNDKRPVYSIVIPPPNVTGALHLGHALNNTLQDILIRMKRMQGYNTLWMPGTDHAGIATQAVVERRLFEEEKKTRHDLGREGLIKRIWDWKYKYEARILGQLRQLGCSCDWKRTRFTLDDQCARAVREWFFQLFKDNKIYRGKRLVNWDTFLQTTVSDDEVFHETIKGHFYYFSYPVVEPKPGEPTVVHIATTRPETMLGDTAVAVHPNPGPELDKNIADLEFLADSPSLKTREKYEGGVDAYVEWKASELRRLESLRDMARDGRLLELPITRKKDPVTGDFIAGTGRKIRLITDEWAKPGLGTGCVKITPGHDVNDYAVWQRHPEIGTPINIMNPDGTMSDSVPDRYRGLKMHTTCRQQVVLDMEAMGFSSGKTDHEVDLPHSDRSKTPIEPYLADQWFVKMSDDLPLPLGEGRGEGASAAPKPGLAQLAMDAVSSGQVKVVPDRYAKGYLDWLGEKRDWPIGRQLWWGHRIPVWRRAKLAESEEERNWLHGPLFEAVKTWRSQGRIAYADSKDPFYEQTSLLCVRSEDDVEVVETIEKYGFFVRDEDVLDTWFSSALWPMSTLGWPSETPELAKFYPTSALITSRDIITLWVARMVIAGLYNKNEIPFHEVYITPKILDGYGETMSKSKGNGVDPLDVIEKFGADALRFGVAYLTTDTQDVKMPVEFECPHCQATFAQTKKNRILPRIECEKCGKPFSTQWAEKPEDKELPRGAVVSERFELGRNFANKLWNAARFSLINLEGYAAPSSVGGSSTDALLLEDRWLLSRLSTVTQQVTDALDGYRYADAARTLYDFAWNEFCSFYVEMTKARFAVPEQRATAQRVLADALDVLLRLLHPMMPFLTEEVWQLLGKVAPLRGLTSASEPAEESVCVAKWPVANAADRDATIEAQFADFQAVLGAVREARQQQNVAFKEELSFTVCCDAATAKLLEPMQPSFKQMANARAIGIGPTAAAQEVSISLPLTGRSGPIEVHVDVSKFIDVEAEKKRLEKERDNYQKQITSIDGKLNNKAFVDKAPAEVVQQQRDKVAELRGQLTAVEAALKKLGG